MAIKDFEHVGRQFRQGDAVQVEGVDAAALARLGVVTLNQSARPAYQTRDMVAVDSPPALRAPILESVEAKTPRRRRKKKDDEELA